MKSVIGKRILFTLWGITLALHSCSPVNKEKNIQASTEKKAEKPTVKKKDSAMTENFDSFFEKFKTDSLFQLSRIVFPLKTIETLEEGQSAKLLTKDKWTYSNFSQIKKLIINKTTIDSFNESVLFSIEDTGIQTTYYFKNKNGLWKLTYTLDESD